MTDHIITLLEFLVQILIYVFMWEQIGTPKYSFIKTTAIYYIQIVLIYITILYSGPGFTLQSILKNVIGIEVILLLYKDTFFKKILIYIICTLWSAGSTVLAETISCRIFGVTLEELSAAGPVRTAGMIIFQDIQLILVIFLCLIYKRKKDKAMGNIRSLTIMLMFAFVHFVFLIMFYMDKIAVYSYKNNIVQLVYQVMIIIMVIVQYYNTIRSQKLLLAEQNMKNLRSEIHHTYEYYVLADKKFSEISELRHDIQNQLQAVKQLINSEKNINAKNVIDQFQDHLLSTRSERFCSNPIINAVLSVKMKEIKRLGIQAEIELNGCENLPFEEYDICSFFSNLLDNSIEALKKFENSQERIIMIKSEIKDNYYMLTVKNNCKYDLNLEKEQFPKTSKEEPFHGYGLKIIDSITAKYNGSFHLIQQNGYVLSNVSLKIET